MEVIRATKEADQQETIEPFRAANQSGRVDGGRSSRKKRLWALVIVALIMTFAASVIAVILTSRPKTQMLIKSSDGYCCLPLLQRLSSYINASYDPCKDFYLYACGGMWNDNGTGKFRNPASQALARLHEGCLSSILRYVGDVVRDSVLAAQEILSVPVHQPRAAVLLHRIIWMSAEYMISPVVEVTYKPEYNQTSPKIQIRSSLSKLVTLYETIHEDDFAIALSLLNTEYHRYGYVKINDIRNLMQLVMGSQKGESREHYHVRASAEADEEKPEAFAVLRKDSRIMVLEKSIPSMSSELWVKVFEWLGFWTDDVQLDIAGGEEVGKVLSTFLKREHWRTSLALYTILLAASFQEFLWAATRGTEGTSKENYCRNFIMELSSLWEVALTHLFASAEKSAVVQSIYSAVHDAVKEEASAIIHESEVPRLSSVVNEYKFQVPSDRTPRHVLYLLHSKNHWNQTLLIRHFISRYYRYITQYGYPVSYTGLRSVFDTDVQSEGEFIYVPPAAFDHLVYGEKIEPAVNIPVVGPRIADFLWRVILDYGWDTFTSFRLRKLHACIRGNYSSTMSSFFTFPWLSLRSCARASMGVDWHTKINGLQAWTPTRSQVFYLRFFMEHVCLRVVQGSMNATDANLASQFMAKHVGFRDAFRCGPLNDNYLDDCLLKNITTLNE
ncbi:uncharacterized protein LOC135383591 isoform X2 [Ornithodoros turicata]|uniref:uncharacterized protein LOC135383591 isoform X2 n=1 Tax=Ornithodoros turicata TaxID=34597 RepID=UPI00313A09B6